MDFGKLLDDVQSLKSQFQAAAEEQNGALGTLQNALNQHYAELEQQVETLKSIQAEAARQQAAELSGKLDELQRAQTAFIQEEGEKADAIRQSHSELRAALESAMQTTRGVTTQLTAQEAAIAQMKRSSEADVRALANQYADGFGKVNAKMGELQTALARQDQSKAVEDLQKRLEALKSETVASVANLGGAFEKTRVQLEQLKDIQRTLSRLREDNERLAQRADKIEDSVTALRGKVRDLASRESGPRVGGESGHTSGGRINWVAFGIGALAIIGLAVGGFFLNRSQNAENAQLQQQIQTSQSAYAAQIQELTSQVKELSEIVNATPTPSPEPTPTATPTPAATAEAEATPKP